MAPATTLSMRCRTLLLVLIVFAIGSVIVPAAASAATVYDRPAYAATAWTCAGSTGAGARDKNGTLYMRCGNKIRTITRTGATSEATYPAGVYSIAPSPTGTYLYAIRFNNSNHKGWTLIRLTLNAARTAWVQNHTGFIVPKLGGKELCGRDIATDHYGYIYVSNGGWCIGYQNKIVKLTAAGAIVTHFGDFDNIEGGPATQNPGKFNVNMGIAVTPDGRRIYVADHLNTRVQYFDWTWNGGYAYGGAWSVPSATYGVELDPWGNVYATSTTQADIFEYTPTGTLVRVVANAAAGRIHEFSIDGNGHVYSHEQKQKYVRPGATPAIPATPAEPRVDTRAPSITALTVPTETTEASILVKVAATDPDGNRVSHMRLADESGNPQAWRAYATQLTVPLTAGLGTKAVYVQVRDEAGRESTWQSRLLVRRAIPDLADPTLSIAAPTELVESWDVTLAITSADDIGVTHLRIAGEDGTFGAWQPWSSGTTLLPHRLAAGFGQRVVFVQVRDAAWRVSDTARVVVRVTRPVVVDEQPAPNTGGGGTAERKPDATTRRRVARDRSRPRIRKMRMSSRSCTRRITIRLSARDNKRVTKMRFANENGRWGRWVKYRTKRTHLLSKGARRKLVYMQVRDAAGNVSTTVSRRTLLRRC